MRNYLLVLTLALMAFNLFAQQLPVATKQDSIIKKKVSAAELAFQKQYKANIKKSYINKVYIPKDLKDAFKELQELAKKESIDKFKNAEESFVIPRIHTGLGRWIILHWNLYDGSRIGHVVREYGVSYPDDQAIFILTTFHRHLNNQPLKIEELVNTLLARRAKQLKSRKRKKS